MRSRFLQDSRLKSPIMLTPWDPPDPLSSAPIAQQSENAIFNKPFIAVLAATMLTLGGCATDARYVDRQAPVAELRDKVVTGNASYRQRIALPARATFNVRLLDVSRADARSCPKGFSTARRALCASPACAIRAATPANIEGGTAR